MKEWRLLKIRTYDAFKNMAIDEAILRARIEGLVPNTLRFYCWNPSAVSIGKFQNVHNEVQLENCKKHGVDVVRRITGGGTVYHEARGELTYSVVVNKRDFEVDSIANVYSKVYSGIVEALEILGLRPDFSAGNEKTCPNLTIDGKKFSGSAQCHKKGVVLQHGTLLVDVDLEKMFTFLRVPWAKTCMEIVNVARRKITSIKKELGREISIQEMENMLIKGFEKALKIKLTISELTHYEKKLAERLYETKYSTDYWNLHGKAMEGTARIP